MKKKTVLVVALAFFAALLVTSCATLFSNNAGTVTIASDPVGADVVIDGKSYGQTPISVTLDKKNSYHVEISKPGYETAYVSITNKIGVGWVVLDIVAGGIPLIVDAVTGAWNSLTPDTISVTLEPAGAER